MRRRNFNKAMVMTAGGLLVPSHAAKPAVLMAVQGSPQSEESFSLMDFSDGVLHDEAWLGNEPNGTVENYIANKADAGIDTLAIDATGSRTGGPSLKITSEDSGDGIPAFFLLRGKSNGAGSVANLQTTEGYMLPFGSSANRIEATVRFDAGFRETFSALKPGFSGGQPFVENLSFGTFHFDPAKIGGVDVKESDNMHFYWQNWVRHDKQNPGWFTVRNNRCATIERGTSYITPEDVTQPFGGFFETLTRFYIEAAPVFDDPEIAYPVSMWCDELRLINVVETTTHTVNIVGHTKGAMAAVPMETPHQFDIDVVNLTPSSLELRYQQSSHSWFNPVLKDGVTTISNTTGLLTVPGDSTKALTLDINIDTGHTAGIYRVGVNFCEEALIDYNDGATSADDYVARSLSDLNCERRWELLASQWDVGEKPGFGPFDAYVAGDFVKIMTT